jgi:hypothetical protein
MLLYVVWQILPDVSEVLTASIIRELYQTFGATSQKTAIFMIVGPTVLVVYRPMTALLL